MFEKNNEPELQLKLKFPLIICGFNPHTVNNKWELYIVPGAEPNLNPRPLFSSEGKGNEAGA